MNLTYITTRKLTTLRKPGMLSFLMLMLMSHLFFGCKKFVTIDVPSTQLVAKTVFSSSSTATAAMLNIYQQMYSKMESFNLELETGYLGDELTDYSGNAYNLQFYTNSMSASNTFGPWNDAYNFIYQANAVIEGLHNNPAVPVSIQNQLTGEAKFIRAFWDFYLTNCYGAIPLANSTSYNVNASIPRTPQDQVYTQIIADLKDAQNLLNASFVDATDTTETIDRVRPTKWAATAMLARVYLYTKDYTDAEAQSSAVIANTAQFSLVTDLNQVFLANSTEAIWQQLIPLPNFYNTSEGYNFILQGQPTTQAISTQLISAFEPNDNRFTSWIASVSTSDVPPVIYYYPFKYKSFYDADITEYSMILRLAEQFLIRAEAQAQGAGNGLNGAVSDLNTIRHRAGLPNYQGTMDQDSVLTGILHERQVELFTEWGHRWFDLIRTNNANSVLGSPGNVCQYKGGMWSPNWQLFPIPQSERDSDHNLSQNNGY